MLINTTDFSNSKPVFNVTSAPAQLAYAGATAVNLEIWNGSSWQAAEDANGTALVFTGNGNFAILLPGYYRLNGTALTSGMLYNNSNS